jgi:hypothetical protein
LTYSASSDQRNRYNFGELTLGESNGFLASEVSSPLFYSTAAAATDANAADGDAGAATARYARVNVRAEAPLLFFAFLSVAQSRRTPIAVASVAGMSAPVCAACGILPLAIAALDPADEVNFGLIPNTKYTLGHRCNGGMSPGGIVPGMQRIEYLLLNRYDEAATIFTNELSQAFRIGAQGLPPNANSALSCIRVATDETMWVNSAPVMCMVARPPAVVTSMLCGLANRFDPAVPMACNAVPEIETLASLYQPDPEVVDIEEYTTYTGDGRRLITIPVVATLSPSEPMQVLGFRQFLLEPNPNDIIINSADMNGRFIALYAGSVYPVKQGSFEGCNLTAGPGKVVIYR